MDKDIAFPREQPPAREDGHWRRAIWDFFTWTVAFFTGNRRMVEYVFNLIKSVIDYGAQRFRRAPAAPDEVGDAGHETNPDQTDHPREEVVAGDDTDGHRQSDNRNVRFRGKPEERREPDTANSADQPDSTFHPASQAPAAGKTVHMKKVVKRGDRCPQFMDARNTTIEYSESRGKMRQQANPDQTDHPREEVVAGDDTGQPQTGPFDGANRVEIDTLELSGNDSPFAFFSKNNKINYQ